MTGTTKMIFRKWSNGAVIALMPYELGTNSAGTCQSYEHIGQHGSADPQTVVLRTSPATPLEFAELKSELERIGYVVEVIHRVPSNAYSFRADALRAQYAA